jgi:hypothetical protein
MTYQNLFSLLFADDTTLFDSDKDVHTLVNRVNMEFCKVAHYFRVNKLSLHLDKTKFMLFSSNKTVQSLDIELFINKNSPNVEEENPIFYIKWNKFTLLQKFLQ